MAKHGNRLSRKIGVLKNQKYGDLVGSISWDSFM